MTEITLCKCGRGKKCPVLTSNPDGSFTLSDVDQPGTMPLRIDREQAELLAGALQLHGVVPSTEFLP